MRQLALTLQEIRARKKERKKALQKALKEMTRQLKALGALKIILFGSFAEGEVDVHSDLDLFVLMPSTKTGKEWMSLIYGNIERGIDSDIIVYNQSEFHKKLPTSSFLQNILKGRVVYEKTS